MRQRSSRPALPAPSSPSSSGWTAGSGQRRSPGQQSLRGHVRGEKWSEQDKRTFLEVGRAQGLGLVVFVWL